MKVLEAIADLERRTVRRVFHDWLANGLKRLADDATEITIGELDRTYFVVTKSDSAIGKTRAKA